MAEKPNECLKEGVIAGLIHDRDSIKRSMESVSTKLDLILAQITKVAILEERHSNSVEDINRAHVYIETLEGELKTLAAEVRDFMAHSRGMMRMGWVIWTILSSGLGMMLAKLFFFMPPGPSV